MLWQLYWDIDIVVYHIVSWKNIAYPARGIVKGGLGIFCRERGMRLYAGLCKNVLSLVVFFVGWIYNSWCTPGLWCTVKPLICIAPNTKNFRVSSRFAFVIVESFEARCWGENEDVVGAVPTGYALTKHSNKTHSLNGSHISWDLWYIRR